MSPPTAAAATPSATVPAAAPELDAGRVERFRRRMTNPLLMGGYMLARLPLALAAGLRVRSIDAERCRVSVPYGWRTTNPFRSIYFAAQSMAAELSTGALVMLALEATPTPVSMLIVGMEASFTKKATDEVTFTCEEGDKIFATLGRTLADGEPATAKVETVGRMSDGTEVSRFSFTWSLRKRPSS